MLDPTFAKLRRKAVRCFKDSAALRRFCCGLTPTDLKRETSQWEMIDVLNKRELQQFIDRYQKSNENIRRDFGIRVSNAVIVKLFEDPNRKPGEVLLLTVDYVRRICSRYDRLISGFNKMPAHAIVAIDSHGSPRIYLVEFQFYGEMCALFNLWLEQQRSINLQTCAKLERASHSALCGAVVTSVFNFLESYLNGLAADYLIRKGARVKPGLKADLTEWDENKGRKKRLSFRDKLVRYPRIVSGKDDALLQENNCEELAFLVGYAKALRNLVVHPSAQTMRPTPVIAMVPIGATGRWYLRTVVFPSGRPRRSDKSLRHIDWMMGAFGEMPIERIVDYSISLVRKIEAAIGHGNRLKWLVDRGRGGFFPNDVLS